MNRIIELSNEEREQLFTEAATKISATPVIVEKDFWVVWVLDKIFKDARLNKILMFKGGTSLSKVFNLIGRFSEDIDLILDWREVTKEDPCKDKESKNKQVKFNQQVNENAIVYIKETLLPIVQDLVAPTCNCKIDEDNPFNINISYPATFKDGYLRNEILLEIGPLASWTPSDTFEISAYVVDTFPTLFEQHTCKVNAILAKRTFWEKATILHQEANRSKDKKLPIRYSRHYYDLAMMAKSSVKDEALSDMDLLEQVVDFKLKFYPATWAKFEEAKVGTLKLIPSDIHVKDLEKDYRAMENMIFDKKLTFEEILSILKNLEDEINSLSH
jgi:hypothetical protein